jgi:trehalose/maltose transport system substrate-binding protein
MKIRRMGAVASVAALAATLVACSSGSGGTTGQSTAVPKGKVSITWSANPIAGTGDNDLRTVLVKAFEKKYPNINVKIVSASTNSDTNRGTLTTQISGGSSTPDVYLGDVVWPAQFAKAGIAQPLSDYLKSDYWNTFAPGLVDSATYKGKVYAAPFFLDESFLFYRKDLLAAHNLPVPTTWDQVLSESKTLQGAKAVKNGFDFQGNSYEGLTCNANEFMADAGGSIVSKDGKKATVNSAANLKAVQFMRQLVSEGVSPTAVSTYTEQESMTDFANGNAAFLRNWSYAYSASNDPKQSKVVGKVGVATLPSFDGSGAGYSTSGGWDLYVNPHSKQLGADLAFIKYMTSPEAQTMLEKNWSEISTISSVRGDASLASISPVMALVGKTKLSPRPSQTPAYPDVSKAVYTNINAALTGSKSPQDALTQAQKDVNTALSGGGL